MEENRLTVAYATDRKLYPYLPTVINSLLEHNPDTKVYVFAEDDEVPNLKHPNITVINLNVFNGYLLPSSPQFKYYLPYPTFTRLWIADVIPESKVLWLDVDTLVDGNLDELRDLDMKDNIIAGVLDCGWNNFPKITDRYINAGVLLINLENWRKINLTNKARDMINTQKWQYGDQDIINKLCKGKTIFLNPRYNYGRFIKLNDTTKPIKIYHWPGAPKQWESKDIKDRLLWLKYYVKEI